VTVSFFVKEESRKQKIYIKRRRQRWNTERRMKWEKKNEIGREDERVATVAISN
jgi:hypothetical protein